MATQLTDYTTVEKVRSALGLSVEDVPDAMMVDKDLALALLVDLTIWHPTHADVWAAYIAPTPTAEETLSGQLLALYSQWFCAAELADTWYAVPQSISDGKAEIRRFSNIDLKALTENAKNKAGKLKELILEIIDPTATVTYSIAGIATPSYDPVTNIET